MSPAREVHGVSLIANKGKSTVLLVEQPSLLVIDLGEYARVVITPNEARHLASKLRRLARRIDARITSETGTPTP